MLNSLLDDKQQECFSWTTLLAWIWAHELNSDMLKHELRTWNTWSCFYVVILLSGVVNIWRAGSCWAEGTTVLWLAAAELTVDFYFSLHQNVSSLYGFFFLKTLIHNVIEVRLSCVCTSCIAMLDSAWRGWMNPVRDSFSVEMRSLLL